MRRWEWCELLKHSRLSPTARLIGFCLASYADNQGCAYPSVIRLATDAGYRSERTARRALRELVKSGYVFARMRRYDTSLYQLTKPTWL